MYDEADNITQEVAKLKNGDESAFAVIYNQTYKYVYSRAKCMFSDEEEVQDLVQEVYLTLYRNAANIQSNESIYGWLKTTTFYQGTKMLQKKRKEVLLSEEGEELFEATPDDEPQIEEDYMNKEDVEVIRECINRLSDEQKTVLLAYYYDNLKVDEIADMLEMSAGTIKSRLYLARKNLQVHIETEEKKRGYKLHSFGAVTLALAIRAFLQTNMETAESVENAIFNHVCQNLNFKVAQTMAAEQAISNTITHEVAKESAKQIGKKLIVKVAEIGVKKVALSVTGIVTASAVAVGAAVGPNIEKPKEPEHVPGIIENVQEHEVAQGTETDEEVPSNTDTNGEEDKQIEEVVSDKSKESSVKKEPSTSDTANEEETPSTSDTSSAEETPIAPDTPTVEQETEEETSSSSTTPSTGTEESDTTTPNLSQSQGNTSDSGQWPVDGSDQALEGGSIEGDTWEDSQ